MSRAIHALFPALALSGLLASSTATAQQVSFTVTGEMTHTGQGYTAGQPVSLTFVLDDAAARLARTAPVTALGGGGLGWYQDLFTGEPQLWSSITGTGFSGTWLPPIDQDTGSLTQGLNTSSGSNTFQMQANSQLGSASGVFANGLNVSGLQVSTVFLGLDPVGSYGGSNIYAPATPDPTLMFLSMVGTYATDRVFTDFGSIWTTGPGGGQSTFRVDTLTIAAVVPEPASGLLLAAGCGALGWLVRRRRLAQP